MSLLIKALDKAQAEKAQAKASATDKKSTKSKVEKPAQVKNDKAVEALSLETVEKNIPNKPKASQTDDVPNALKGSAAESSQKPVAESPVASAPLSPVVKEENHQSVRAQAQAANVFTAKQTEPSNRTAMLAIVVGFIALGLMGALAYWYQSVFNAPDIVIPPRPVANQEMPEALPELVVENVLPKTETVETQALEVAESEAVENIMAEPVALVEPIESLEPVAKEAPATQPAKRVVIEPIPALDFKSEVPVVEETLTVNETVINPEVEFASPADVVADLGMASESASIKMTRQQTEPGVNPVLMRAYEAYKAGDDTRAQQDYMQVLKRYGPNVDAMLGLGAIAVRQKRLADAGGWYRKVLEAEPRNDLAKSGLLSLQQSQAGQPTTNNESNIKSMIATAPNDANLYAALGDLYADQQQWSAAQQAYFDAYRFNSSAENAFNLGVSLDQLGKPALALPYYREALQKAGQSNAIDTEALKARIASIE